MTTPAELAAEMDHMAKLHPGSIWSVVMAEGAAMIRELSTPEPGFLESVPLPVAGGPSQDRVIRGGGDACALQPVSTQSGHSHQIVLNPNR